MTAQIRKRIKMTRSASPLRYPGGKACLVDLMKLFLARNNFVQRSYAEPYSGGCGLALSLLFSGHVSQVYLNDLDRSIWAFWRSVLEHTDDLVALIEETDVTVDEWQKQRTVQVNKDTADVLTLGFSTFFLNRTSRSGIIHSGGIIGGKSQIGTWKIDCRYNKIDLIKRIKRVSQYKNRIHLENEDAELFMKKFGRDVSENCVLYIDPPYYDKGSKLYKNAYRPDDHSRIAKLVGELRNPWLMTYDNVEPIRSLYDGYQSIELDIGYSVQTKKRGSELLVVSDGTFLPVDSEATVRQSRLSAA